MFDPSCGGPSVVVHGPAMPAETRAALAPVARLVELGGGAGADPPDGVSTAALLAFMRHDLGAETVLCEGGGILVAQLFAARAVDELYLTLVPRILGGASAPTLVAGPGFGPDQIPDARLASLEEIAGEVFLRYEFTWG
jgi:riboflavin biosynthesis pyrimidine reductase